MGKKHLQIKDNAAQKPSELSLHEIITPKSEREYNYARVALDKIHVEGQSVREFVDDDHVIELSMSMSRNGLLEPIVLQSQPAGNYQLIAGFHRLTAAHRLNWPDIPAHIITDPNANVKALALIENVVRKDMTLKEECDAVAYLVDAEKASISQICDLLGKSRAWVEKRLMSMNLPEDLKQPLFDGTINIGIAEELGRMTDESQRRWLTNYAIVNRVPKSALSAMVAQSIENPSVQSAVESGEKAMSEIQATSQFLRSCGACGAQRDLTELTCVWVCKAGCLQPSIQNDNNNK